MTAFNSTLTDQAASDEPFSVTGPESPGCSCGAGPHPEIAGRCAAGHVGRSNDLAVVTGATSTAFWQQHAEARQEIAVAIIRDAGSTLDDAPRALTIAADSIAQAMLIRDSAYLRMTEAGGPLSSHGRVRRAFAVWTTAIDRLERHLRLVGLERRAKPMPTLAEIMATPAEREDE